MLSCLNLLYRAPQRVLPMALLACAVVVHAPAALAAPTEAKTKATAATTLPIQSWTTPAGAKVLFMRTEALPMLDIQVNFAGGSRAEPEGKIGVAGFTAGLIGKATPTLDENQIADGFADTGAQFGVSASADSASASLRSLTTQPELDKSLALFKQVITQPVFKPEVLQREQKRALSALKESLTKPATLADRAFSQALYPNHPYGRVSSEASIQAITVEDLQQFYAQRYVAGNVVVAMVGNLSRAQAEQLTASLTEALPKGKVAGNPVGGQDFEPLQAGLKAQTIQIAHPAAQSHIQMGLPAMRRGHPDYFKLLVANHVLGGGGFVSRLMKEVREERGLAYSAYSYFMPLGDAGPFQLGVQTKKEQTAEAIGVINNTLKRFVEQGPTQAELDAAKSNLIGGFPLRIDSNSELVGNLSMMGWYGLPLNYLDQWTAEVAKVTLQDAKDAFARHVPLNKVTTVVVGGQE